MPNGLTVAHFTLQVSANGPILTAVFAVSEARRGALLAANVPVPQPTTTRALVDTGASCTSIDPSVVTALGLQPTGSASLFTPSTGNTPHQTAQYDVAVAIFGPDATAPPLLLPTIPVISAELLQAQGFHALIGRDILSRCIFTYNGAIGLFTLAF